MPAGETVLLVGGGLGNAVLFSIGAALRAQGSRVLYFAGYKTIDDRYKVEEIERAADVRRLVLRRGAGLRRRTGRRTAPSSATSSQAMAAYGAGELGAGRRSRWATVDRIIVIGSDGMMSAVGAGAARRAGAVI